jgi:hypothetical protein
MLQDFADNLRVFDESDDAYISLAFQTDKGINLVIFWFKRAQFFLNVVKCSPDSIMLGMRGSVSASFRFPRATLL